VLLVEDYPDTRELMTDLLGLWGHEVRAASDGPAAVEEALRWQPDVALIDIGLPQLDGCEVARAIRADARGGRILLVALTGYGSPQHEERIRAAGFDAYLIKPADSAELARILEQDRPGGPA
jgi:two-component system CheB/CheR fusion protein